MKVKVVRSFSDSVHGSHSEGAVIDLPEGVDWLRAGLVEVQPEPEAGAAPEPEAPKVTRKKAKGG